MEIQDKSLISVASNCALVYLVAAADREDAMTAIMPKGELLRRAVAWVDAERNMPPDRPLAKVLDEAAMRFNLTPKDFLVLEHLFIPPAEERKKL